jgi:hypothetical protein
VLHQGGTFIRWDGREGGALTPGQDSEEPEHEPRVGYQPIYLQPLTPEATGDARRRTRGVAQSTGAASGDRQARERFDVRRRAANRDRWYPNESFVDGEAAEVEAQRERRVDVVRDDADGATHLQEHTACAVAVERRTDPVGELARQGVMVGSGSQVDDGFHAAPA